MELKNKLINWFKVKKSLKKWENILPESHFPWITIDAILFIDKYINWLKSINVHPSV